MRFIAVFLFATIVSFLKLSAQAPVNDECSGAINIIPAAGAACTGTVVTSNAGATQSLPGCAGSAEDDIWFKFTATSTRHLIQVSNGGADYPDAVFEIFSGSCGALSSMGCYQEANGDVLLDLSTLNAGQTYYCRYYGAAVANERTSKITICISTPPLPANDECTGALEIPVNSDTSTVKNLSGSLGYPTQSLPNCFSPAIPASDAWFKFTATSAAHYITVSSTSSTNYVYEVFSGSCSNLLSLVCVNPVNYSGEPDIAILKNLIPGQVYYLRLYDNYNHLGSNLSPQYKIVINTAVPDDCSGAITVTPGIETYCTKNLLIPNKGASSSSVPVCYGDAEDNIWFKFTATSTGHRINVSATDNVNPVIEVFSGSCSSLSAMGCYYTNYGVPYKDISADLSNLVPGNTYYYRVYGAGSNSARTLFNTCISSAPLTLPGCVATVYYPQSGLTIDSYKSVDFQWVTVPIATSYDLYLWSGSTPPVAPTENIIPAQQGTTTYTKTGLAASTTYNWYMAPRNAVGAATGCASVVRTFTTAPQGPANDECAGALNIPVNNNGSSTLNATGTLVNATASLSQSCIAGVNRPKDVWYKFTATAVSHRITVDPYISNDLAIQVYSGTCASLTSIACINNTGVNVPEIAIISNLVPGNTYYVRIFDCNFTTYPDQNFTVTINTATLLADYDNCTSANTTIPDGSYAYANNVGATQSMPGCYGSAEDDVWFKFTATSSRHLIQVNVNDDISPVLEVFGGTCSSLTSLKCSYNMGTTYMVSADISNFIPGQTYYYRVYGAADNNVRTRIATYIVSLPPAPPNDECEGAVNLPVNSSSSSSLSYTGNIGYASQATLASCDVSASAAKDVWFKFTASATSQNIKLTPFVLQGYSGDYVFQVYSGTCGHLTPVVCVNTGGSGIPDSTTVNNLIPGTTYYIRVFEYFGAASPNYYFTFTIQPGISQARGTGLLGNYYSGTSQNTLLLTRIDTTINFEFTSSKQPIVLSPAPGIVPEDRYSVKWTGKIQPQFSETYTFYTISDDGIRLKINGQLLVNNFSNIGAVSEKSGSIELIAGQQYDIVIDYFELTGDAITKLLWSSPSTTKQIIPKSQLFPPQIVSAPACTLNNTPANGAVTGSANSALLSWNTVAGADGYKVYISQDNLIATDPLTTVTTNSYNVTGLLPSTSYRWYVVPFNTANDGAGCSSSTTSFTTAANTIPAATGTGLRGIYYNGTTLSGTPLLTRIDTSINYELTYSKQPVILSPAPGIVPEDGYSVRWAGKVQAQFSETYTFYTVADDGIRLWVNGQLLVDNWTNQGATEKSGTIALTAGQQYNIVIEYFENTGEAVAKLLWSSPSTPKQTVPKSQLYPPVVTAVPSCTLNNLPANGAVTGTSASSASLSWNSIPEADGYKIFVWQGSSVPGTALATVTNNSYTLTGLLPSTTYRWYIVPFNAAGDATGCSGNSSSFTTAATAQPAGNGTGLQGVYFNGTSLSGTPLLTRTDATINFELTYSKQPVILSPAPGIVPEDGYSVRWTGKVQPQFSETYTFYTVADDGIRLWVNGQLLVDNWTNQGPTEKSGTIALTTGQQYNIVIEYYENTGEAVAKLLWSSPGTPKQIVPKSQLYVPNLTVAPSCTLNTLPANATIVNTSTTASLYWNSIPEAQGYRVYGWLDNPFDVHYLATVSTNNYSLTGLEGSTTYYWYVVPFNAAGDATGCSSNTSSFITARAEPPAGNGTGMQGVYFNGTSLAGTPLLTRTDTTINFELTYSKQPVVFSPAPGIVPEDLYSVRWTGQVQPLYSETYTFYTVADDGVRLWVNGQLLVDNWTNQGATEKSGSIALVAGQKYDIVIEYYESAGEAVTKLLWSSASTLKQIVPSSQLYPPAAGTRVMGSNLPVIAANVLPASPAVSASLSPNPVRPGNLARLQISSNKAGTGIISVSSSNGRTVSTEKIKLVTGINTAILHTRGLAQGLYIITVTGGSKPFNLKLLVE